MAIRKPRELTRRSLLKTALVSSGTLLVGLDLVAWPLPFPPQKRDPFAGGTRLGTLDFINEGSVPLDTLQGSELDGRQYTDLAELVPQRLITATEKFYIRTRASELLPDPAAWHVKVGGLVEKPLDLPVGTLIKAAKPMGTHVMECAGNVRLTRFALLSAGRWAGVLLTDLLGDAKVKSSATRVLISGFDHYAHESKTSVPGASWVFSFDQLKATGAFLATELNDQSLTRDHGFPVRLFVPGWYGCACIKWVDEIALVSDEVESTSQMREYAARTLQKGVPELAKDFQPAIIEQAAMPIRVEKWSIAGKIKYRVVGIAWGGSQPVKVLQIRFNPEEDYEAVENFDHLKNDPWTLWSHTWSPKAPGTYSIRLAVKAPVVRTRRLDSGYYVRSVEIAEV